MTKIKDSKGKVVKIVFNKLNFNVAETLDTLKYNIDGTNFGFWSQDKFLQYFVAPADLKIKVAGFIIAAIDSEGFKVSIRLIKLNVPLEKMQGVTADKHIGCYPFVGDGFNNIDAFGSNATGYWEDLSGGEFVFPLWTIILNQIKIFSIKME